MIEWFNAWKLTANKHKNLRWSKLKILQIKHIVSKGNIFLYHNYSEIKAYRNFDFKSNQFWFFGPNVKTNARLKFCQKAQVLQAAKIVKSSWKHT